MQYLRIRLPLLLVVAFLFGLLLPATYVQAAAHSPGTNVLNNGTIYMIANGQRRAYTSAGAFLSYGFNSWGTVVTANAEDMALPEGSFIPPRDGKIVCSDRGVDKGTCYLITNGKRGGFTSEQVFKQLGFSFSKALYGDVSFLEKDSDIDNGAAQHRPGVLVNKHGTIYLVSSNGLMGIPSPDVLKSWGYSFDDAINANANDAAIPQYSVIAPRQGAQLKPSDTDPFSGATEQVILQSYLNSYPPFPANTVSSPEDVAAILTINNNFTIDSPFSVLYPYMTSSDLALINRLPDLKELLESSSHSLYAAEIIYPTVTVYEGKQRAIVIETIRQGITGYSFTTDSVYVKENGVWKVDLLGTIKRELDREKSTNPSGAYFTGNGSTDIGIAGMEYENENVYVNDRSTRFLVEVANYGETKIHNFDLILSINNVFVYGMNMSYELLPNQNVIISLPIASFWDSGVVRQPGEYRTDVNVEIEPYSADVDREDNGYYITTNFQ